MVTRASDMGRASAGDSIDRQSIEHIPEPHPPEPHPPNDGPPDGWQTGKAPGPAVARAAAGTLNCLTRVVPRHRGQWGTSFELRTRVSKAWSQGSQRYSYIGIARGPSAGRRGD